MLVGFRHGSPRLRLTQIKPQPVPVLDSSCFVAVLVRPRRCFMNEFSLQSDLTVRLTAGGIPPGTATVA